MKGFLKEEERKIKVSCASLDQWAMDFEGNRRRVVESLKRGESQGVNIMVFPELTFCGASCGDHFLEEDTYNHCWEILGELLYMEEVKKMMCVFGLPARHKHQLYNCAVLCFKGKVVMIRPKMRLNDQGNSSESRYFKAWEPEMKEELFEFPKGCFQMEPCKIGNLGVKFKDTCIVFESLSELTSIAASTELMEARGAEIIINQSCSYFEFGTYSRRAEIMKNATLKGGGLYLYSNQFGCDGGGLYFDGGSLIALNGQILALSPQTSFLEKEMVTAVIDLEQISRFRNFHAEQIYSKEKTLPAIEISEKISITPYSPCITSPIPLPKPLSIPEEIGRLCSHYL